MTRVALAIAVALLIAACRGELTPPTGPGTDYPCGVGGIACVGGDLKPTGFCCSESEVCGGAFPNVGCAPGMCCFVGEAPSYAARAPHPQRPAR